MEHSEDQYGAATPLSEPDMRQSTQIATSLPPKLSPIIRTKWSPQRTKRQNLAIWFSVAKHWLPEVSSLVFAILVFVAIVVLLATQQGKPKPQWPSLLSINALLSILTTLLKISILYPVAEGITELKWIWFANAHPLRDIDWYEAAGRGPWGALKLLCRRPADILTILGAVIVVVTLAVDPFSQQILDFYSCSQPVTGSSATILRTNNYTIGGFLYGVGVAEPDGKMTAALYKGLLDPPMNATSTIPSSCSSGNCTFSGTYRSLEMCTSVSDISNQITERGDYDSSNQWGYFLPSGHYIAGGCVLATTPIDQDKANYEEERQLFAMEILMLGLNCNDTDNMTETDLSQCSPHPQAFHVTLSPCLQTYSDVGYWSAVLSERLETTIMLPAIKSEYYSLAGDFASMPGVDCTPSTSPLGLQTLPTVPLASGLRYAEHRGNSVDEPSTTYINQRCVYEFGFAAASALRLSLSTVFFGKGPSSPNNVTTPRGVKSPAGGDEWLKSLWAKGRADITSVRKYMEGLASTISTAMREEGDPSNSEPFSGIALVNETCVGVTWAWLALSAALLLLSLIFVVLVSVRSGRYTSLGSIQSGRKPWKSSTLPLMWCGIEDQTRYGYPCMTDIEEMEASADEVKVRLRRLIGGIDGNGQGSELGYRGRWILQQEPVSSSL